jgi:hypothetical protein
MIYWKFGTLIGYKICFEIDFYLRNVQIVNTRKNVGDEVEWKPILHSAAMILLTQFEN